MKAARYYGPGDVRVEQVEEPVVKAGQIKIKVCFVTVSQAVVVVDCDTFGLVW